VWARKLQNWAMKEIVTTLKKKNKEMKKQKTRGGGAGPVHSLAP